MKFLVINRPNGREHGLDASSDTASGYANAIEAALADGTVEAAYAFIAGGAAYVVTAKDTEELAMKVRFNPLFKSSHTEVHPIADAVDFLRGSAEHL